jgi:TP901 family phage tail tape measure protein
MSDEGGGSEYSLFSKIGADDSNFQATFSRMGKTLSGFGLDFGKMFDKGSSVLKGFGIDIGKMAGQFGIAGGQLAIIATVAIEGAKALHKLGAEFDAVNETLAKTTGKTGKALQEMNSDFQDLLASHVEQDLGDLSKAYAELNVKMGLTGDALNESTKLFADFADVTGQKVTKAVEETTDVMNKWGLSAADLPDVLDQITRASQLSGAKAEDFTNILKQSGAQLQALGLSLTDSVAMFGAFRASGVNTETVMRGLNTAIGKFSKDGRDAKVALQETFDEIRSAKTPTEGLAKAVEIFGSKAGIEMYNALVNGKIAASDFKAELLNAGGVVERTAESSDTLTDKLAVLGNSSKALFAPLGEAFNDFEKVLVDLVQLVVDVLYPVFHPILEIVEEVFRQVDDIISAAVEAVAALIENNPSLAGAINYIQEWAGVIIDVLGKVGGFLVTLINIITDLANGDWENAWARMQLLVLKYVDIILTELTMFANGIIIMINSIIVGINMLLEKINVKPIKELAKVSLTEATGISKVMEKLEKEIEARSKRSSKEVGKNAKASTNAVVEATKEQIDAEKKLAEEVASWAQKAAKDKITQLNLERDAALKKIDDENNAIVAAGGKRKDVAAVTAQINEFYDNEILKSRIETNEKAAASDKELADERLKIDQALRDRDKETNDYEAAWKTKSTKSKLDDIQAEWDAELAKAAAVGASLETIVLINEVYAERMKEQSKSEAQESAQAWVDAAQLIDQILSGIFGAIAGEAAQTLTDISTTTVAVIKAIASEGADAQADIAAVTGLLKLAFQDDAAAQEALQGQLEEMSALLMTALGPILKFVVELLMAVVPLVNSLIPIISAITISLGPLFDGITWIVDLLVNGLIVAVQWVISGLKWFLEQVRNVAKGLGMNTKELDNAIESLQGYNVETVKATTFTKAQADALQKLKDNIASSSKATKDLKASMLDLNRASFNFSSQLEAITESTYNFYTSLSDVGTTIADELIKNLEDGLTQSDFLESMKKYITNMIIQAAVFTESLQAEMAAIGSMIAAGISGGMSEADLTAIQEKLAALYEGAAAAAATATGIISTVFTSEGDVTVPGHSLGSDYLAAGYSMVGEAGPEIIKAPQGAQIMSAGESRRAGVGGSVSVTLAPVFQSPKAMDQYEQMRELKKLKREIAFKGSV